MPKIVNLVGKKFGKLTAEKVAAVGLAGNRWICKCTCGETTVVYASNLQSGKVKSCGCSRVRHGMSGTKIHHVWRTMLDRCINPNANQYADYGGRGIFVCDEWKVFTVFYEDMGAVPYKGATLDRVDNNKPYCKSNCKWSSRYEQARNKRSNRIITVFGRTQTVTDWAVEFGMPPRTLFNRLFRAKMSPEDALNAQPYAQQRRKRT